MAVYRTAQGRQLDWTALAAKHEQVRAVGNMKVNARGDTIDASGKVIVPVTEKVANKYAKTVGQRSAQQRKTLQPIKPQNNTELELTKEEQELLADQLSDEEIMALKTKEQKK